jgi:ubiquinone/menaquinone biosynthesis C-methylase UbiE|tara:strand:+ start:2385 stop:2930 length:546 start_codon:yes stop_codon:yes gene_type:complete
MIKLGTDFRIGMIIDACKADINKKTKVLDIGAGNGYVSHIIQKKFGCNIYCADILKYLEYNFPFSLIKDNKIQFKNKSFDVAIINDTLHHMPKNIQIAMIKEATRVAKKVLIFETKRTITAMVLDNIMSRIHHIMMPVPCTHKNSSQWRKFFFDLGLKYEEKAIERKWYYPLNHLFFVVRS